MKKWLSFSTALVLMLALTMGALATPFYLETAGVTIQVPDGMEAQDTSDEGSYSLTITSPEEPDVAYYYQLGYIEGLKGIHLEDLDESQLAGLEELILAEMPGAQGQVLELDDYYVLAVAAPDGSQLHYISLLNGWLCDVSAQNQAGETLTDANIDTAAALLAGITFDSAE